MKIDAGQKVRLPGERQFVTVQGAMPLPVGTDNSEDAGGTRLFVTDVHGELGQVDLSAAEAAQVEVLVPDAGADPSAVLAGMWAAWMRHTCGAPYPSVLASSPLRPYAHQSEAVLREHAAPADVAVLAG